MSERIAFAAQVTADGRRIRGSVQLAGQRTRRNGEWVEVDPAAIVAADASDVVGRWEHDPQKILGRPGNGTLELRRTDQGIEYELTDLPPTTYADDALALVRGGYVSGSSFEIGGQIRSTFSTDPDTGERVRRIVHIERLVDVSPVAAPAFAASTAAAFAEETEMPAPVEGAIAPTTPPAPPAAPTTFSETPKSGKDEWAAFARDLSTEQIEATLDQIFSATRGDLQGEILDRYEGFAAVLQDRKRIDAETRARAERMQTLHALRLGRVPKAPDHELFASDDYHQAFARYVRGEITAMEQFAQAIAGDGTQGGYLVPEAPRTKIVETMAAFGGIQKVAEILETGDGRTIPYPTNDDTANSAVVASEGAAPASAGADLVFGEVALGAFSVAATGASNQPLKVSWELLQDAAFDVEGFIARKLGERLGRKAAAYYATGVGSTEPLGLLAKTPDTMTATTMRAALVEHHFQVNEAYREAGNCRWILSDTTLAKVWNSVDKEGRPLFIPAAESSGAGRPAGFLLGYPVQLDSGAGNLVAFGDIFQGYIIRRVRGVQVVVDPYNNTATRQTAYHAWIRTDAAIQDSAAVSVSDYSSVTADAVG
jgi:HK97 family phage major capsid protein